VFEDEVSLKSKERRHEKGGEEWGMESGRLGVKKKPRVRANVILQNKLFELLSNFTAQQPTKQELVESHLQSRECCFKEVRLIHTNYICWTPLLNKCPGSSWSTLSSSTSRV
jgi:hypothetical protein